MTSAQTQRVHLLAEAHGWHRHPGVRSGHELTVGERAADRLRNGMGSWAFAAKRSDQIAAELAQHDYSIDTTAEALLEKMSVAFSKMGAQHEELQRQVAELNARLGARAAPGAVASAE
jgi:hypothetical protein